MINDKCSNAECANDEWGNSSEIQNLVLRLTAVNLQSSIVNLQSIHLPAVTVNNAPRMSSNFAGFSNRTSTSVNIFSVMRITPVNMIIAVCGDIRLITAANWLPFISGIAKSIIAASIGGMPADNILRSIPRHLFNDWAKISDISIGITRIDGVIDIFDQLAVHGL